MTETPPAEKDNAPGAAEDATTQENATQKSEPESPQTEKKATVESTNKPEEVTTKAQENTETPDSNSLQQNNTEIKDATEKGIKKIRLGWLRRRRKDDDKDTSVAAQQEMAEEAKTPEEVTQELYKQLAETKASEYVIIKIKKKKLLLLLGFLLVLLWLVPIGKYMWQTYGGKVFFNGKALIIVHDDPVTVTEKPESLGPKIRIRNTATESAQAERVAQLLTEHGYTSVEIVNDDKSVFSGVGVVVKAGQESLAYELQALLEDSFTLASTAAELTLDSDFDAVIFTGE